MQLVTSVWTCSCWCAWLRCVLSQAANWVSAAVTVVSRFGLRTYSSSRNARIHAACSRLVVYNEQTCFTCKLSLYNYPDETQHELTMACSMCSLCQTMVASIMVMRFAEAAICSLGLPTAAATAYLTSTASWRLSSCSSTFTSLPALLSGDVGIASGRWWCRAEANNCITHSASNL